MLKRRLLFALCLSFFAAGLRAQSDLVDLFSGDFNYNVPGVYIPSSNGPGVPIGLNYKSGITPHQKSSWVGLGWNLDVGEIKRDVNGIPDDWVSNVTDGTGVTVTKRTYEKSGSTYTETTENTEYFGPMYFHAFKTRNANKEMDVYASGISGGSFFFPDFDNFVVSAPGVSGVMQPLIMDVASMVKKNAPLTDPANQSENPKSPLRWDAPGDEIMDVQTENYNSPTPTSGGVEAFNQYRKAQFRYLNEPGSVGIENLENNQFKVSPTTEYVTDPDPNKNYYKAVGAKYVAFYTKQDIVNNTNLDGLIKAPGYDYVTNFRSTDIVAFKITNEFGYTYHFSLPVLLKNQRSYNIEFNPGASATQRFNINDIKRITVTEMAPYVVSWKLVAVTGPGYVDNSPFNTVDGNDAGYWVKYTYALWENNTNSLQWQSPYLDANRYFGEAVENFENYKQSYPNVKPLAGSSKEEFTDQSNFSKGNSQMYYLEKIETNSHTAFFVKALRFDEHAKKPNSTDLPLPALALRRIIVVNNADAPSLFTGTTALANTVPAKFTIPGNSTSMIHESKYQATKAQIDLKTVSAVEFVLDHSLCKNYTGNVYNNLTPSTTAINLPEPPAPIASFDFNFDKFVQGGVAPANSGKLTLLKVVPYGAGGVNTNLLPSVEFQYSAINPDFHPHKKDFWGYYLNNWTDDRLPEYQIASTISDLPAWNLTKIATPLGGIIEVEYESDQYSKVGGYDGKVNRIYSGRFVDTGSPDKFEFDDPSLYDLITANAPVGKVSLGYPCQCKWSVQYTYPPVPTENFNYVYNRVNTVKSQTFNSAADFTTTLDGSKTKIVPSGGGQTFDLVAQCGEGPNYPIHSGMETNQNDVPNQARAIITLNSAYGGGLRVKRLKMIEKDVNAVTREYTTEYTYGMNGDGNGVASQEPSHHSQSVYFRSALRDLYDRHANQPAVGYSQVVVKNKGADGNLTDNYYEANFNNYNDYRYGPGNVGVRTHDKTSSQAQTNWDLLISCIQNCTAPPCTTCYELMEDPVFNIKAMNQTGLMRAWDQSRTFIGKLASSNTYDKNGRLISANEQEYQKFNATSSVFYQKTHGVVPLSYDPDFLVDQLTFIPIEARVFVGQFGPFDSQNSRAVSTVLNTRVFYEKIIQNERIRKQVAVQNDVRVVTEFEDYDPITGLPKRSKLKDPSTGEEIIKEVEFAYTDPTYDALGPKGYDQANKNLLTLVSLEKTTKGGVLVEGMRRTFKNNPTVRSWNTGSSTYVSQAQTIQWVPEKTFVFNENTDPLLWREDMEYTVYNAQGDPLEFKNYINANLSPALHRYGMIKKGHNNRFVLTEASDSRYTESTYSGAEDTEANPNTYFSGEVKISGNTPGATVNTSSPFVHTGKRSLKVNANGGIGFEYKVPCTGLNKARKYMARVWVFANAANVNTKLAYKFTHNTTGVIPPSGSGFVNYTTLSGANNQGYTFNGKNWTLLTLYIDIPTGDGNDLYLNFNNYTLSVYCENPTTSGAAYFDDFRFHPTSSSMTNYVYNTLTGQPEFIINSDGFYTRNSYDAMGSLYRQYVETPDGEKQVAEINRNFYRFSNTSPFNN